MHSTAQKRRYTPLRFVGVLFFVAASAASGGVIWKLGSETSVDRAGSIVPIAVLGPLFAIAFVLGFLVVLGVLFNMMGWFQDAEPDHAERESIAAAEWAALMAAAKPLGPAPPRIRPEQRR